MTTIDVIIPAKNEEQRIQQSIAQFQNPIFNNVIVINDTSTDKTNTLAKKAGATVVDFPESTIPYHQAQLYHFGKILSKADYILIVDVDEVWDRSFLTNAKTIVEDKIRNYPIPIFGYKFPRNNYTVRGEPITTWPDLQIRLLMRDIVEWKDEIHPVPYHDKRDEPIDNISCLELPYSIIHLTRNPNVTRPWWKKTAKEIKVINYLEKKEMRTL